MNLYQQAEVWLKVEQADDFLLGWTVEKMLADKENFTKAEQMHSQATAEAQARISFEDGKQEGYRQVANWIERECSIVTLPEIGGTNICLQKAAWDKQLKKWGINEKP